MSPLDGIKLFAKGAKVMKNATDELSENQQLRPSSSVQSIGNFVSVFMAGRNCPQCLMTETPVPPEAILNACRNFLGSKCAVTQTTTEDGWQLLWAVKKKSLFLNDQHVCAHERKPSLASKFRSCQWRFFVPFSFLQEGRKFSFIAYRNMPGLLGLGRVKIVVTLIDFDV